MIYIICYNDIWEFFLIWTCTYQIINHGISQSLMDGALSSASGFFNLPTPEKMKLMSNDVHKPVRYATSIKDGIDNIQLWRVFLKHYAHPLEDWIHSWPANPPYYRYFLMLATTVYMSMFLPWNLKFWMTKIILSFNHSMLVPTN